MERTTRTFEVTLEKSETITVNRRRKSTVTWCSMCGCKLPMLTPEDAALVSSASLRDIYRGIEDGQVHFIERPDGVLLICIDSLGEVSL